MSLYIRVENSFWRHRKTLRLRAMIGDAAFWIPPRLWSYASENQPDGCFKDYSYEEIAQLLGYEGDADKMVAALVSAKFMDSNPLSVHDWSEHARYHAVYAERASKAARARWAAEKEKEERGQDKTGQDKSKHEPSIGQACVKHASSIKTDALTGLVIPDCLKTASFESAWQDWLQFRREIRKPVTPTSAKQQLAKLAQHSAQAVEMIRNSIQNGWQGLFETKPNAHSTNNTQNRRNSGINADPIEQGKFIADIVARRAREREEARAKESARNAMATPLVGHGSDAPGDSDDGERGTGFLLPLLPK